MIGIKDVWRDAYLILIIALILIEGEVLVDILHIWTRLVTGIIGLRLILGLGRVTLRIVILLITVEDAPPFVVVVGTPEVVIVIACRVVAPSLDNAVVGDDTTVHHCVDPLLVGIVLTLLVIVKSVETYILQTS